MMAIGLTMLMAFVVIGVTEYFLLEQRMDAAAKREQDDLAESAEGMESLTRDTFTLDDLIQHYDRMEDE